MLFDMLWFCVSRFRILINKVCTIRVMKSFFYLFIWEVDVKYFGWEKGCGLESSFGG